MGTIALGIETFKPQSHRDSEAMWSWLSRVTWGLSRHAQRTRRPQRASRSIPRRHTAALRRSVRSGALVATTHRRVFLRAAAAAHHSERGLLRPRPVSERVGSRASQISAASPVEVCVERAVCRGSARDSRLSRFAQRGGVRTTSVDPATRPSMRRFARGCGSCSNTRSITRRSLPSISARWGICRRTSACPFRSEPAPTSPRERASGGSNSKASVPSYQLPVQSTEVQSLNAL